MIQDAVECAPNQHIAPQVRMVQSDDIHLLSPFTLFTASTRLCTCSFS
jgi:hypothetical protein